MREQKNLAKINILSAFAKSEEIATYEESGYFIPMIKIPSISEIPDLPIQERKCLKILIKGHETKEIASKMSISEDQTRALIISLRKRFNCSNTRALIVKVYRSGWSDFV